MNFDLSRVHGIVVPVITPLNEDESIDESSLHKIINYLLDAGVHGIFVNSTTGEGVCLSDSDRKKALKIIVNAVNGTVPVYASISDTGTKRALWNLKEAEDIGADIAVAHPPFYYPPNSQDELDKYYEQIARVAAIPVMLYNIPFTTQAPIALKTIQRLLEFETIIGIKDSSVDFVFLGNLITLKAIRPDFKIFVGKSHLWTGGILSGADGGLDGISNLIPEHCVRLYDEIKAGSENIFDLQREINEIWRVYECRSFLGGIKAAMSLLDLCKPITAKPTLAASEEETRKIRQILLDMKILS
ncbi:MAG: dihydrodipicolinate synthase family protein [Calditrichaeota bacterium]|nr:dihydrodipicolinate synthase family protein [Calditrichota bacterium]